MTTLTATVASAANNAYETPAGVGADGAVFRNWAASAAGDYILAARFALDIPQGTFLNSAVLTLTIKTATTGDRPGHTLWAEDADDAAQFDSDPVGGPYSFSISTRSRTAATVVWGNASDLGASVGDEVQSSDLSALVEEVVNRAGWASGNHLVICFQRSVTNGNLTVYDYLAGFPASLDVTYGEHYAAAVLAAVVTLTAVPYMERAAIASLASVATLTAVATVESFAAVLSSVATLTAVGTIERAAAAVLEASASLVATGDIRSGFVFGAAVLAATASVAALAALEWAAGALLSADAQVTAAATHRSSGADYATGAATARQTLRPAIGSARPTLRPRPGSARMEW